MALVSVVGSRAWAGNAGHAPTQVQWGEGPCLTVVDRSVDPVVHIRYDIPFEDVEVTTDEVDDSRTHQFFAVCESTGWHVFLPPWVSEGDVEAAAGRGLVDPDALGPDDVLETSTRWADCWWRITADDARRPITFDAADAGVDWDTTALSAGVYIVEGYTHEPPKSQWVTRPGVYKVVDSAAQAVGPAVAITTGESIAYVDTPLAIDGCVDAAEGATVRASWGSIADPVPWATFAEVVAEGESFSIPFTPSPGSAGTMVAIRVEVVEPDGASSTALMLHPITVLDEAPPCDDEGGCDTTGAADSGASSSDSASDADSTGAPADAEPTGCSCHAPGPGPERGLAWLAILGATSLLTRRRAGLVAGRRS
ncbi:MAG: hypothetical protein AAF721_12875 [Myxococcota bacterium]